MPADNGAAAVPQSFTKGRLRWILFCACFASFIVNVNTYIVNISLPEIARFFSVDTGHVSFVVQAFQLSVTGLLLVIGRIGDSIGLRRMFVGGFIFFALASLLCGISPHFYFLVAMRFVQGIAASILYALTPALIAAYFPAEERGPAFGIMAIFTALGMTLGTSIGGFINAWFSWHGIFLVNVPIAIIAGFICWKAVPGAESSSLKEVRAGFDYQGSLISMAALMILVTALGNASSLGWTSPYVSGGIVVSVAMTAWFWIHEKRHSAPLLDLKLLSKPELSYGNIASILGYMFLSGTNFLIPFYLTNVLGYSSDRAGLIFMVYPLLYMVVGPASGYLSKYFNARTICTFGMGMGALASIFFAFTLEIGQLWPVVVFLVMQSFTFGTFTPSNNNLVMCVAPVGQEGQVSALYRMLMRVGLIIGLALFETVFSLGLGSYAQEYAHNPAGVPTSVIAAAFRLAYIGGFVCCIGALAASRMAARNTQAA